MNEKSEKVKGSYIQNYYLSHLLIGLAYQILYKIEAMRHTFYLIITSGGIYRLSSK